jgi:hypothetical protein
MLVPHGLRGWALVVFFFAVKGGGAMALDTLVFG